MFLKLTAPLLMAALAAAPAQAQFGPTSVRPTMLIHGNYCGPGNNAPLAPIDALDAACARHDACTPDGGMPSKSCNLRLQAEAERVANDRRQPDDLRMMAGLIASGAAMMPSDPLNPSAPHVGVSARPTVTVTHRPGTVRRSLPAAMESDGP